MNEVKSTLFAMILLELFLLLLRLVQCSSGPVDYQEDFMSSGKNTDSFLPQISPNSSPQPLLPLLAPSPLTPFVNSTIPKLSGRCTLNFSAGESLMSTTAVDCFQFFAPLLANVICCPQLEATLTILIGQSSKHSNVLALNGTTSKYCLSDFEQTLEGQGADTLVSHLCSVQPSNLTEGSCPVKDVDEFENTVDYSTLLAACQNIDPVRECCDQICQNAISGAATRLSLNASEVFSLRGSHGLPNNLTKIGDCKNIVLRWLASKLDSSRARKLLRGLSNCGVNKVCPLVLPDTRHVAKECGKEITNTSVCCTAMENYISHLQKQSLVTNLQALNCATTLAMKLENANISRDVYRLCRITLKDFSLQVTTQASGCLLPSLPSDSTLDQSTGVSFICDLNDNIPAPWPSSSQASAFSCNKTVKIPALPAAASTQNGRYSNIPTATILSVVSAVVTMLA